MILTKDEVDGIRQRTAITNTLGTQVFAGTDKGEIYKQIVEDFTDLLASHEELRAKLDREREYSDAMVQEMGVPTANNKLRLILHERDLARKDPHDGPE